MTDYVDAGYAMQVLGVATEAALARILRRHRIPTLRLLGVRLIPRRLVEDLSARLRSRA